MARHVLNRTRPSRRTRRAGRAAFALALSVLLSGCSAGAPMISVLRGNLAFGRGDYQTALVHYLATEEREQHRGWLLFNSGNVYYALGEQEAALAAWEDARELVTGTEGDETPSGATLLVHAASYNRGVLFYQRGEYQEAYDEFRYALSVRPQQFAAKTNLELALRRIRSAEQAERLGGGGVEQEGGDDAGPATLRILEYVRRKESQRWVANREMDESTDARDW